MSTSDVPVVYRNLTANITSWWLGYEVHMGRRTGGWFGETSTGLYCRRWLLCAQHETKRQQRLILTSEPQCYPKPNPAWMSPNYNRTPHIWYSCCWYTAAVILFWIRWSISFWKVLQTPGRVSTAMSLLSDSCTWTNLRDTNPSDSLSSVFFGLHATVWQECKVLRAVSWSRSWL